VPRSVWLRCAHFFRSGEAAHFVKEDIDHHRPHRQSWVEAEFGKGAADALSFSACFYEHQA
jgi:hypothetical protein